MQTLSLTYFIGHDNLPEFLMTDQKKEAKRYRKNGNKNDQVILTQWLTWGFCGNNCDGLSGCANQK
jgi:hypothetical protein